MSRILFLLVAGALVGCGAAPAQTSDTTSNTVTRDGHGETHTSSHVTAETGANGQTVTHTDTTQQQTPTPH